jgi:hypothetical protein
MLFCWWRYDRKSYLKTWCCRCCFVDGDTIVHLTLKLDVVDIVLLMEIRPTLISVAIFWMRINVSYRTTKVAAYCLEAHEQALVDNKEILTQQISFYCISTLMMLFCWWRYDRRTYLKTWCCRCCFVDGDTTNVDKCADTVERYLLS